MSITATSLEKKEETTSFGADFATAFKRNFRQFGMLIALVIIVLYFQIVSGGQTLSADNLNSAVFGAYSYILILAIGMVFVIIAGHIDLSVGSVAALAGTMSAFAMTNWGVGWFGGIVTGLAVGALVGAFQGWFVAYWDIPAFIVTLAGYIAWRGVTQWINTSNSIPVDDGFKWLGGGVLPEVGPEVALFGYGVNNLTLLLTIVVVVVLALNALRSYAFFTKNDGSQFQKVAALGGGLLTALVALIAGFHLATAQPGRTFPYSALILLVLAIVYSFISTKTILGRHVYAVGGNRHAAELSGVKSRKINFLVMMNMSILASLAGMIYASKAQFAGGQDGTGWELDAISAVFIGGAAVTGGVGTVYGSLIGGLVMAFLSNGLTQVGAESFKASVIKGAVLLVAVIIDLLSKAQGKPSFIGAMERALKRNRN
ncbi:sugar ABC transporter permease [Micrococcales bacterium 31B]|nr:sugar ABC transporter permease [Micrococcales bacterium 31B]